MFNKTKKYPVTSKVAYMFVKEKAMRELMETYVRYDKHDRAVKAVNDATALNVKAWSLVYDLYPNLKDSGKQLNYSHAHKEITVKY